ncbi:PD-(D/E)XK nuclease family transposase, partial [Lunatimonas salinarum]|uniref:PD-(D/E)XK nuclease family transposase n=1 Tax=Lunatimonas salinarum TaxID=1774590 RepID=UPI001AE07610
KFEKWLYVLKHLEFLERLPGRVKEKIFEKVMDIATLTNLEKKDRRAYEQSLKRYRDLKNALDASEQKGLEKGLEKGREEGEQIGLEKGKMEVLRSGIINLYKENLPTPLIAKVMEIDEGTVMRILKEEGLVDET